MKKLSKKLVTSAVVMALAAPLSAFAATDVDQKIEALQKELDALKQKVGKVEEKSLGSWLHVGGDYRFRVDSLRGSVPTYHNFMDVLGGNMAATPGYHVKDDSLFTNRFGLNLKAQATQDVTVTARMLMYKVTGSQDDAALNGNGAYSLDRAGAFDGTVGHVPGSNNLALDRAYATWNNVLGQPVWFSIGRRPSSGGNPSFLRQDSEPAGVSGVPALLVDYAFDGATLGYALDLDSLPGAYVKLCYGRGYENGITSEAGNGTRDTDMLGVNIVPYDTDALRIEFQYNRGMNIFSNPVMLTGPYAGLFTKVNENIGDIDWYGLNFMGKLKNVGPGNLNWFVNGGLSVTHPNTTTLRIDTDGNGTLETNTGAGLLYTGAPKSTNGWAAYVGGRYDLPSGTLLGFEYNHGSKNWITFAPAADDMWTSKLGTRGNVYEAYVIQELPLKPISSVFSKTFFKIGYQYYDFDYTGSNSWLGAPLKFSQLSSPANAQMTTPMTKAQDVYGTFEVHF